MRMPEFNINTIIKHFITMLLTGGIATGGFLMDRSANHDTNQVALGSVIQLLTHQLSDCNHESKVIIIPASAK